MCFVLYRRTFLAAVVVIETRPDWSNGGLQKDVRMQSDGGQSKRGRIANSTSDVPSSFQLIQSADDIANRETGRGQIPHSGGGFSLRCVVLQHSRAVTGLSAVSVAGA
jgi:hypothetical protein